MDPKFTSNTVTTYIYRYSRIVICEGYSHNFGIPLNLSTFFTNSQSMTPVANRRRSCRHRGYLTVPFGAHHAWQLWFPPGDDDLLGHRDGLDGDGDGAKLLLQDRAETILHWQRRWKQGRWLLSKVRFLQKTEDTLAVWIGKMMKIWETDHTSDSWVT